MENKCGVKEEDVLDRTTWKNYNQCHSGTPDDGKSPRRRRRRGMSSSKSRRTRRIQEKEGQSIKTEMEDEITDIAKSEIEKALNKTKNGTTAVTYRQKCRIKKKEFGNNGVTV